MPAITAVEAHAFLVGSIFCVLIHLTYSIVFVFGTNALVANKENKKRVEQTRFLCFRQLYFQVA